MPSAIDSVLAIDAASSTGWAFRDVDGSVCFGRVRFNGKDGHDGLYVRFHDWLRDALDELQPAYIVSERPGSRNGKSNLVLCGLYGVLRLAAGRRGTAVDLCSPSDWKRVLCGSGAASKPAYIRAVRADGYDVTGEDEAAAVGILIATCKRLGMSMRAMGRAA